MKQEGAVYFQKQSYFSLQCGLHSVNHLLGGRVYTKQSFTDICYQLSDDFINPHKHLFGGDYDINVLMMALDKQRCSTKWFDNRKGELHVPESTESPQILGYLVNIYSEGAPSFIHRLCNISRRHWVAVRRIKDKYYWMDSKNDGPREISRGDLTIDLNRILREPAGAEEQSAILTVYKNDGRDNQ